MSMMCSLRSCSLLLVLSCVLVCCSLVSGDALSDHQLYDPVTVQIISNGLGPQNFTDPSRNYLAEYQAGLLSWWNDPLPIMQNTHMSPDNVPLSTFTRTSTASQTIWTFTLTYNASFPLFNPYAQYNYLETPCARQNPAVGTCLYVPLNDGGPLLVYYVGVDPTSQQFQRRQWLLYFDSVLLQCCNGKWAIDRAGCPDCAEKNYLPLILGCILGFVGFVIVIIALIIGCRVRRRRQKRGIVDAGHKAPPKNLGPAFDPKHTHSKDSPVMVPMMQMRGDHAQHATMPVVIKIKEDETRGKKHTKQHDDEDQNSKPEGGKTEKNHYDKQADTKDKHRTRN